MCGNASAWPFLMQANREEITQAHGALVEAHNQATREMLLFSLLIKMATTWLNRLRPL